MELLKIKDPRLSKIPLCGGGRDFLGRNKKRDEMLGDKGVQCFTASTTRHGARRSAEYIGTLRYERHAHFPISQRSVSPV